MPATLNKAGECVALVHESSGAKADIHLFGATVTSWTPANAKRDYLWLSQKAHLDGSKAIRGGIPICFPIFGPPAPLEDADAAKLPQHGLARIAKWRWSGDHAEDVEKVTSRFLLDPSDLRADLRDAWPKAFELTLSVILTAKSLEMVLKVSNASPTKESFTFQALMHTYHRVPDSTQSIVTGLNGLTYHDKTRQGNEFQEKQQDVQTGGREIDRVYANAPDTIQIRDGSALLVTVKKSDFKDAVVWNPGPNAETAMNDFGPSHGWKEMLCVEPGMARDRHVLKPGETWQGGQTLVAHL